MGTYSSGSDAVQLSDHASPEAMPRTSIGKVNSTARNMASGSCRQKGSGVSCPCCTRFTVAVVRSVALVLDLRASEAAGARACRRRQSRRRHSRPTKEAEIRPGAGAAQLAPAGERGRGGASVSAVQVTVRRSARARDADAPRSEEPGGAGATSAAPSQTMCPAPLSRNRSRPAQEPALPSRAGGGEVARTWSRRRSRTWSRRRSSSP